LNGFKYWLRQGLLCDLRIFCTCFIKRFCFKNLIQKKDGWRVCKEKLSVFAIEHNDSLVHPIEQVQIFVYQI